MVQDIVNTLFHIHVLNYTQAQSPNYERAPFLILFVSRICTLVKVVRFGSYLTSVKLYVAYGVPFCA